MLLRRHLLFSYHRRARRLVARPSPLSCIFVEVIAACIVGRPGDGRSFGDKVLHDVLQRIDRRLDGRSSVWPRRFELEVSRRVAE